MNIHENGNRPTRIAAIADLHIGSQNGFPKSNELKDAFAKVANYVDAIAICGDFTETGLIIEAEEAAEFLKVLKIPVIGVTGNRERVNQERRTIVNILSSAHVTILDGQVHPVSVGKKTIRFTGTEGSWQFGFPLKDPCEQSREKVIFENGSKSKKTGQGLIFDEKLEQGLQRLGNGINFVLLHYPPVWQTGISEKWAHRFTHKASQLEIQLDRSGKPIHAVLHGHTHDAPHEGKTEGGITVYNVALPVNRVLHNGNGHDTTHLFRTIEV